MIALVNGYFISRLCMCKGARMYAAAPSLRPQPSLLQLQHSQRRFSLALMLPRIVPIVNM